MKSCNVLQEIVNNATTDFLDEYQEIGKFMIEKAKEILKKEDKDIPIYLIPNHWRTCANEKSLQFGGEMIKGVMKGKREARRYYYCFTMDNDQYSVFIVSSDSKNKMNPETKLASILLEEIVHVLAGSKAGHKQGFFKTFIYLWKNYFPNLKLELKEVINNTLLRASFST